MTTEPLGRVWDALTATSGAATVYQRLHPESRRDLYAVLDRTTMTRTLKFERVWRPTDSLPSLVQSRAVRIEAQRSRQGTRMSVLISLADPAFTDVFSVLASDVAAAAAAAEDDHQATAALFEQLERWRVLLQAIREDGLSPEFRRGLFAELHLLGGLVLEVLPAREAVEGWTGPLRSHQDFQYPSCAVEVKSTVGPQPQSITVASERELDGTGTGTLYLLHVSVDERQGGDGESLNDSVAAVEAAVAADTSALTLLRARLALYGYHLHQRYLYDEPRYSIRETGLYRVEDQFPRIIERQLSPGVGSVRYKIAITACEPWRAEDAELQADLAGGGTETTE
ncbi:PD-(D/E)XK motif protein [Pseudonocardia sp. WMMC193]|uniref:PD-(D/E)XK motif protein n=1 Tax=Pseudonocardia sp. WMMC193 TaxID=2911965 RepID=UPI001F226D7D|nr:PD-(D/E)XK motif protein [Pseudonocardia sp. WMMC193]MCF7552181.1 PD-(D/E)XK motif protein [Pseudonocardia sp. WMMC193]